MHQHIDTYLGKITTAFDDVHKDQIRYLAESLKEVWKEKKQFFLCGNGGSAGNAIHLANDFNYGVDKKGGMGLRTDALPSNASIITCLANDEGYDSIFSQQLEVKASAGDVLLVLSGSGNSPNVVKALETGNKLQMKTFAILGFTGGKCKELAQTPIHFPIADMQVVEDLQVMIGHMCMQYLSMEKINGTI